MVIPVKSNDPFVPLPPAWKLISHIEREMVVPGTDRWLPQTIYERSTDQLRVIVTDDVTPVGTERIMSVSSPYGATAQQIREAKRLFLKPDVKYRVNRGRYNTNVELYYQTIEGKEEKRDGHVNMAIADAIVANPSVTEFRIESGDDRIKIHMECIDGWWRYRFSVLNKNINVTSTHEWSMRMKLAMAVAMNIADVDGFNPDSVSDGRVIVSKRS